MAAIGRKSISGFDFSDGKLGMRGTDMSICARRKQQVGAYGTLQSGGRRKKAKQRATFGVNNSKQAISVLGSDSVSLAGQNTRLDRCKSAIAIMTSASSSTAN